MCSGVLASRNGEEGVCTVVCTQCVFAEATVLNSLLLCNNAVCKDSGLVLCWLNATEKDGSFVKSDS